MFTVSLWVSWAAPPGLAKLYGSSKMPAFTYLVVPEGPSCETQPGSTEHLIPHQTRPGFFTESPQVSTRGYKPQHASSLQASAWMMSAVASLVQSSPRSELLWEGWSKWQIQRGADHWNLSTSIYHKACSHAPLLEGSKSNTGWIFNGVTFPFQLLEIHRWLKVFTGDQSLLSTWHPAATQGTTSVPGCGPTPQVPSLRDPLPRLYSRNPPPDQPIRLSSCCSPLALVCLYQDRFLWVSSILLT